MKKIFPILLTSLVAVGFTSCDDTLDVVPKDKLANETYFTTATDLEMFTNPYYNNIPIKDFFTEQSDQLIQRTLSDEIIGGIKRYTPEDGSGSHWEWSNSGWKDLRRINTLLENVDKCQDQEAKIHYTAVSRFFRAYFYAEKLKHYGDVPWYDKQLGSADPDLYKARDSREFIMTKIIEDVDYAIEHLKAKKDEKEAPYRVTIGAALALKSRICLFEGTWRKYHNLTYPEHDYNYYLQLAADAAQTLMDRKEYSIKRLTGKTDTDYRDLFVQEDADKDEYIFSRYSSSSTLVSGTSHNTNGFTLIASQGQPGLTRKFICSYLMKDGRRFTDIPGWQTMQFTEEMKDRDPRLSQTVRGLNYKRIGENTVLAPDLGISVTGYQPIKFVQQSKTGNNQNDNIDRSTNDLPWMRYAEVLLNYAEAKAELGSLTQDDLDKSVNLLRKRVGMPDMNMAQANAIPDPYLAGDEYGYPNVTGNNKGVILEIRRERGIELVMEGFRLMDLFRWKAGKCLDQPLYGMYFPGAGKYDLTGDGKADLALYNQGDAKPSGVGQVYEIGKEIFLSDGNRGYFDWHVGMKTENYPFNETRDYLYPIPANQIALNPNLVQNPGWE